MTDPNGPAWKVTGTTQTTNLGTDGNFVEGLLVSFSTARGHTGSVFLPLYAASPENVRAAITARVAVVDSVLDLNADGY